MFRYTVCNARAPETPHRILTTYQVTTILCARSAQRTQQITSGTLVSKGIHMRRRERMKDKEERCPLNMQGSPADHGGER